MTLPATLEGEELPLNKQSGLTKEELERKSAEMLDNASEMLAEYWNNVSYDGHACFQLLLRAITTKVATTTITISIV